MQVFLYIFAVSQLIVATYTYSNLGFEMKFVQNRAATEEWKEVVVVHCSERASSDIFMEWRKVFDSLVYVKVFDGNADPIAALSTRIVEAELHILILPTCSPVVNFIVKASKNGFMNRYFSWWILWNPKHLGLGTFFGNTQGVLQNLTSNLQLPVNSYLNIVSAVSKLRNGHKTLCADVWDVFRIKKNKPIVWRKVETWCETFRTQSPPGNHRLNNKFPSYMDKIRARSAQIKDMPLRVGVIMGKEDYSYDCKVQLNTKGEARLEGYSAQILNLLQNLLQFKDEYVLSKTWGGYENGTWSGLMGLLTSEKADIILCHPTITPERQDAVEFLHPTLESNRVLVYRVSGLPLTQDVFVLTFSSSLWLCLFVAMLLLILALSYATRTYSQMNADQLAWSWVEVSLWAISVTCQQGTSKEPLGPSCCMVFIVGYISSYLIFTAFAAGVTSLLAVEGQDVNLQLDSLAQMNLKLTVYLEGLAEMTIKKTTANNPFVSSYITKELSNNHNRVHSMSLLMGKLKDSNHVSLGNDHAVEHFMLSHMTSKEACPLTVTLIPNTRNLKAFAVPKNSAYKEIFNYWLLRIHEGGLLHAASQRSLPRKRDCGTGPGYSSAGIGHVMSAIMILGAGVCASIFLLLIEIAWSWHKKRQFRRNKKLEGKDAVANLNTFRRTRN